MFKINTLLRLQICFQEVESETGYILLSVIGNNLYFCTKQQIMRKISADIVYPVVGKPLPNGVITVDEQGVIRAVEAGTPENSIGAQSYKGIIVPGFINAHCHLELSHMKGKVATGTELIPFITNVVKCRNDEPESVLPSIQQADQEMYEQGIMAVGDISNCADTFEQKQASKLRYYTFVELFDFKQIDTTEFEDRKPVFEQHPETDTLKKSYVPHAPYSVSEQLFQQINEANAGKQRTVSIHNQETPAEDELALKGTGPFIDFVKGFGLSTDAFAASGRTSIHYALKNMDPSHRTLFVHNTMTTENDIIAAHRWSKNVFWVTCPNANLYIENRLPNYQSFLNQNAMMTIGTDSLTSNWQLSILEELKTILKYQSYLTFETVLQWATLNGALALGFQQDLGSIEYGKSPGLNLLAMPDPAQEFDLNSCKVIKLV